VKNPSDLKLECAHCHQPIVNTVLSDDGEKAYCCYGCKVVDELINQKSELISHDKLNVRKYLFLDEPKIRGQLVGFEEGNYIQVSLHLPQIHCSSCIYLLENLPEVEEAIHEVKVNFGRKEAMIGFASDKLKLSQLAAMLDYIGYPPDFQTRLEGKVKKNKRLLIQLGVAGFFFGNTMLLALPEYLHGSLSTSGDLKIFFRYLMMLFSLPVVIYSAQDYFVNAIKSLRAGSLSIDLPIALGISVLFTRSAYEVMSNTGAGYFDSLTGLVFLLLVGKWFQQKTYENFTFDRDYRSFIPLAANLLLADGREKPVAIDDLDTGDLIVVRQGEVLPADSTLESKHTEVDYSYITGEAEPLKKLQGDRIFAGARIKSGAVEFRVADSVDRSYLSSLWNKDAFKSNNQKQGIRWTDRISQYFTPVILLIALASAVVWSFTDITKAVNVFTAVLIVACPCALALAEPFASGSMMRWFGRFGLFLKNSEVLLRMENVDKIVFDKTGTLTRQQDIKVKWEGDDLKTDDLLSIKAIARQAQHPLAQGLLKQFPDQDRKEPGQVKKFEEFSGEGLAAETSDHYWRLGKASFLGISKDEVRTTSVYVEKDGKILGYFAFYHQTRDHMRSVLEALHHDHDLALLSGDNEGERRRFDTLIGDLADLRFNHSPHEKLEYLNEVQQRGKKVMMIGDGLNDAGALQQSEVGISLCEKNVNFFPASDALLTADSFAKLPAFIRLSRKNRKVIHTAFGISFAYNAVGLSFAIAGVLSPVVCAILMPISSISVVIFTTMVNQYYARRELFENSNQ
jgi:Cu+-exporting ATPase